MTTEPSTHSDELRTELDFAIEVARAAGEFTQRFFRTDLAIEHKSDGTPVTQADRGAEALMRAEIAARFPSDGIIGEEHDTVEGTSGRTWVLDPIDGTKSFTHGVPLYANLVALVVDDEAVIGVINSPATNEMVWAAKGGGAHTPEGPARVSSHGELRRAWLMTSGFGVWPVGATERVNDAEIKLRTWGDAYGYLMVATGRAEAMVDPVASVWDLSAPSVIVREAGGTFTAKDGSPSASAGSGLGSNGLVHDDLLRVLFP
ncbi:MAG: histidinol phosphate phosphatase [Acidimicrobiales bacterium]|nr:histidinol phosphate phosphatase [Acidimicrobiales bacterium]